MKLMRFGGCIGAALALGMGHAEAEVRLSIAATGQSSSYYAYHAAVVQVLEEVAPDLNVTILETGGSEENMRLLLRGEASWGQLSEPSMYEIYSGTGSAAGDDPETTLRYLAPVVDVAFFNVVNADSGITDMAGLQGEAYGPGSAGSTTEKVTVELIQELGIDADFVSGSYGDLVAAMKDRRIIGYTKSASLTAEDATILDVRSSVPVRIIGFSDSELETIRKAYPHYLFVHLDETPYGADPVTLAKVVLMNGTTSELPEEVGYQVYKALVEHNERVADFYKPMADVDVVNATLESAKTPLHAGVVRYLREIGQDIPGDLVPPEAQ